MPVQARAAPPATAQQPQPQPPSTVPKPRPPEQQTPIVVEKRAPATRQPGTPTIPTLRPTGALGPAAGRLPRTGVDPRLLGAGGTFLIGLGLAMLAVTPPRRV
jgi:hypothetical protein